MTSSLTTTSVCSEVVDAFVPQIDFVYVWLLCVSDLSDNVWQVVVWWWPNHSVEPTRLHATPPNHPIPLQYSSFLLKRILTGCQLNISRVTNACKCSWAVMQVSWTTQPTKYDLLSFCPTVTSRSSNIRCSRFATKNCAEVKPKLHYTEVASLSMFTTWIWALYKLNIITACCE